MRSENVTFFTDKEEELANLLIIIGIKKNIARILVYLANIPEATSHDIEHETDMRQSALRIAMRCFMDKGWVRNRESFDYSKGRPLKTYELVNPSMRLWIVSRTRRRMKQTISLLLYRSCRKISANL